MKKETVIRQYQAFIEVSKANLASYSQYTTSQLQQSLTEDTWSIIQVFNHLLLIEKAVLNYATKKASDKQKITGTFRNWWKAKLTVIVLNLPIKFKAPALVSVVSNTETLAELQVAFAKNWNETKQFLAGLPEETFNKLLFKHPRAGMLTLEQTIDFLVAHLAHHQGQLKALKNKLS